jgi:cyclopropane fatty-acyl-phospholipid synthase-like methyltransferase
MISSSSPVTTHEVADHYDELDRYYREIWGEHVHHGLWERGDESAEEAVLHLIRHVARRGQINAGKRVCDVGCGYGGTARVLGSEFGAIVSAITLSPPNTATRFPCAVTLAIPNISWAIGRTTNSLQEFLTP